MTDRLLLTVIHLFITKLFQDVLVLPAQTTIRMQFIRMCLQGPCREESGGTWAPPLLGNLVHTFDFPYERTHSRRRNAHKNVTLSPYPPSLRLLTRSRSAPPPPPPPLPLQNALRGPRAGNIDKVRYPIILKPREWTRIAGFVFSVLHTCLASKYCTGWDRECIGHWFHLLNSFINEYSPFCPGSHVWQKLTHPSGGTSYIVQYYVQFMVSPLNSVPGKVRCTVRAAAQLANSKTGPDKSLW